MSEEDRGCRVADRAVQGQDKVVPVKACPVGYEQGTPEMLRSVEGRVRLSLKETVDTGLAKFEEGMHRDVGKRHIEDKTGAAVFFTDACPEKRVARVKVMTGVFDQLYLQRPGYFHIYAENGKTPLYLFVDAVEEGFGAAQSPIRDDHAGDHFSYSFSFFPPLRCHGFSIVLRKDFFCNPFSIASFSRPQENGIKKEDI